MKCGIFVCVLVFVIALAVPCFAAGETWCPPTIRVEQKAESPSKDWSLSYSSSPTDLEMVTFFSGPPEENASLVYDERLKVKDGWVATWKFPKDSVGYWIRCSYGGTRAELSRRLPDRVSFCRVSYDESMHSAGVPVIRKIECR